MAETSIEVMKGTLTAMSAQMDPQTAAYIAQLDDDGVKQYYRTMLEQQETMKFAMQKQAEYAAKSSADIAAEMAGVQDSLTDEERMTLYKAGEFIQYVNKLDVNGKANAYVDILVADKMAQMKEQIQKMSREELVAYIEEHA